MRRPWRVASATVALVTCIGAVVWITWPLARFATTHIPGWGSPDTFYAIWALAWQTHALLTDPARYFDANIYHPVRHALAYGPTGMGALLLFAPVYAVTNALPLATNVLFIGGSALTAWTTGRVATRWTRSVAAGVIAASTYLATPWMLHEWGPNTPHFAMLMWLPLIIERAARPIKRVRDGVVLSVMIALQGAVEIVYVAPAVLVPLALISVVRLCRRDTRTAGLRLGLVTIAAVIALSPLLAVHLAVRRANPGLALQTPWGPRTAVFRPAPLAIPWGLFGQTPGARFQVPLPMALPPLAFGLIACGVVSHVLRRREREHVRAWRHATLWTLVGVALALPAEGVIFGAHVRLPYGWLCEMLPAAAVVRVPMRLGVIGLFGLSLLAGLAFAELVTAAGGRRWRMRRWTPLVSCGLAAVVAVAMIEQPRSGIGYSPLFAPPRLWPVYPAKKFPPETPYAAIVHAQHGPLLEVGMSAFVPPLLRPVPESQAMIRSTAHWEPLLNGYSSYWPEQYVRSMSLAARLPEDAEALAVLREETGVNLILVWPNELKPIKRDAWAAVARAQGSGRLVLLAQGQQGALLFRVR